MYRYMRPNGAYGATYSHRLTANHGKRNEEDSNDMVVRKGTLDRGCPWLCPTRVSYKIFGWGRGGGE